MKTPLIIKETAQGSTPINIIDELFKNRVVFLNGEVNSESADNLIEQFMYLSKVEPEREISFYINSPGGEVLSGLAVYDTIKLISSPVRTGCTGMAASMGAILFLAGDKREILPNSQIMIHDPAPGGGSMAGMKPEAMEETLSYLKQVQNTIIDIISSTTKQPKKVVLSKTRKDTYFSAEEAVKFGLATDIVSSL